MKYLLTLCMIICTLTGCDTLSKLPGANLPLPVTEADAAAALRQALDKGVSRGINNLHRQDGFFGSAVYKLLLPPEAEKIESTLRQLGMGPMVDRAILQINRAAEDAVGAASPIFLEAIREMSIQDALGIVRAGNNAATEYFRQRTKEKLVTAFSPIIKASLDKFSATKHYADVVNTYNNFPTTLRKLNPDLPGYVTDRSINALFDQIAQEEAAIRANPAARTTELLKRVFGSVNRGF